MAKLIDNFRQQPTFLKSSLALSLVAFIFSLTQPAFYIDRQGDPNAYSDSFTLFLLGWMSFLGGALIPFIIWLANPLYFIAIVLTIRSKPAGLYFSLGATCLAFVFSQLDTIITSESGSSSAITDRGLGFTIWFTSFIILTIGLVLNRLMTYYNRKAK